jgi:DNA-binding transcriptional LysR family regulator
VFEAVARLKSFTQAADELTITQPALSRTIQQLEDALGVTLLDRSSRHVEATQAGRMFLDHVERVLAELERGFDAVRRQASIRLGFSWLLPDPWAQDTVALFERGTGTTVSLIRTDDALAAVQQGKVDVAVVRGHVTSTAVRVVHLFNASRVAVCSAHSPLADRSELDWAQVPRWPLVVNTAPTSRSGAIFTPVCGSSPCVAHRRARSPWHFCPVLATPCCAAPSRQPWRAHKICNTAAVSAHPAARSTR